MDGKIDTKRITRPLQPKSKFLYFQEEGTERAKKEGVAIALETLALIKDEVEGVQISPPLGKYEQALEALEGLR